MANMNIRTETDDLIDLLSDVRRQIVHKANEVGDTECFEGSHECEVLKKEYMMLVKQADDLRARIRVLVNQRDQLNTPLPRHSTQGGYRKHQLKGRGLFTGSSFGSRSGFRVKSGKVMF